jgi:hypothetical protein
MPKQEYRQSRVRPFKLPLMLMAIFAMSVCAAAQNPGGPLRDPRISQAQSGGAAQKKPPNESLGINP